MAYFPGMDVILLSASSADGQPVSSACRGLSQLIIVAEDERALRARFPVWPESELTAADLACLLQPARAAGDATTSRLLAAGWLRSAAGLLQAALPVYEQVRESVYPAQLAGHAAGVAARLTPFVDHLRQTWRSAGDRLPAWEQVAHNLVIGFWLGACGSRLLLKLSRSPVAALLVAHPAEMAGAWFSLLRLRPDLALVDLQGSAYPAAASLGRLLREREVMGTLASGDQSGRLIISGDKALRLLRQLSAYRQTSPGPWLPNDYWLQWPLLTPEAIRRVRPSLELACRALRLAIDELLIWVDGLDWPGQWRRGDLALLAWIDLAGRLQAAWTAERVLPAVVTPWLEDWQVADAGVNLQTEMLKGLGR